MGNKRNRLKKFDRKRDDNMKGYTKRNQDDPVEVQEDAIQVEEQFDENIPFHMGNLMEMNDESFFSQFSSDDLVPQSTIKKQCKKIWDEYFQSKSLIGKAQLFVRLFRKKEMTPVLELLGVDNKKNSGDNVNRTIVENLQDALNDINNSS
jgi:hypothetical protein